MARARQHEGTTWAALWPRALVIAITRIALLWLGASAYRSAEHSVAGYMLLMLSMPEIYLARAWRDSFLPWLLAGSAILALSSLLWAALWVWAIQGRRAARSL
jgi:hypothetical protein